MPFDNFFSSLSQTADDASYVGIFGTTAQTLALSANLGSLSAEGGEIVKWVRYRLGEPKITVELHNLQIFAAFEEANQMYAAMINVQTGKNWLSNLMGLNRNFNTQDLTNKLPHSTFSYLQRIANPFATEGGVGGVQNVRKAYLTQTTDKTDFSILNDFVDETTASSMSAYCNSVGVARPDIRKVWYSEPVTVYRFYDPYSSTNVLSQEFQYESIPSETIFEMYPIWTDILRAGMLETNDRVRRSNVSYHIFGDRLRLLPKPNKNLKIWIEYTTEMDPFNPNGVADSSVTGISNIATIPFKDIKYEDINSMGKVWIRQYCLAICIEILGRIRRKYNTIPIPNNEVTLDGDALVAEGIEKQQQLKEDLKTELAEMSNTELMKNDAEEAQAIEELYKHVPMPVPFKWMG